MIIIDELKRIFPIKEIFNIEEKVNSFNIGCYLENFICVDEKLIKNFFENIPQRDRYKLTFQINNSDPVIITEKDNSNKFCIDVNDQLKYYEEKDVISIELDINKFTGVKSIYHYESFKKFINDIELINLLSVFKDVLILEKHILFIFLEDDHEEYSSSKIRLSYNQCISDTRDNINYIREHCNFGNIEEYPFTPDLFHLIIRPLHDNSITKKLDIYTSLFSIISIFDITSINGDELYYKLNGYKTYEGKIRIDDRLLLCNEIYYKIYEWVYSTEGNIADKLGLVRNILSIYLDKDIVNIDDNILSSIKSSYNTYLKENVERYIGIRNKIFEELSRISQKSSEIIEQYLANYQKSIFTFLSFFISMFILGFIKHGDLDNIFSKEPTILSCIFLFLSTIYLFFSIWILKKEKERLMRKYMNIKTRYEDLLDKTDIDKILNNDKEFYYEIEFIDKRSKTYTLLWLITLLVLFCAIMFTSNYWNWAKIYETIFGSIK